MNRKLRNLLAASIIGLSASFVPANAVTFTGTSGSLSAEATFLDVGGNLQVTLTNTGSNDALANADLLTAVFWSGTSGLTPFSALLGAGSVVLNDTAPGGNVGGEFAYASSIDGPLLSNQGISSAGFGLFGDANFNGSNLDGPAAVNGPQYGLTSAGDNTATGNPSFLSTAMIKNSVVFTLLGSFNLASITNVFFQFGTALTEPGFPGGCVGNCPGEINPVPIPAALPLLLAGLGGLGWIARRQRRNVTAV